MEILLGTQLNQIGCQVYFFHIINDKIDYEVLGLL